MEKVKGSLYGIDGELHDIFMFKDDLEQIKELGTKGWIVAELAIITTEKIFNYHSILKITRNIASEIDRFDQTKELNYPYNIFEK